MRLDVVLTALFIALAASARAEPDITGEYACTVHEKAGIASIHLEGADPPKAYLDKEARNTFGILISQLSEGDHEYAVVETNDRGENPDRMEYHTQFTTLHSVYMGDGMDFTAVEDQAFLRLHHASDRSILFYHAGFEYPGGDDVRLSVRYGECKVKD